MVFEIIPIHLELLNVHLKAQQRIEHHQMEIIENSFDLSLETMSKQNSDAVLSGWCDLVSFVFSLFNLRR